MNTIRETLNEHEDSFEWNNQELSGFQKRLSKPYILNSERKLLTKKSTGQSTADNKKGEAKIEQPSL